jgi:hypothetical protein
MSLFTLVFGFFHCFQMHIRNLIRNMAETLNENEVMGRLEVSIPSSWLGYQLDGQQLNGTGFATFRLVIELSEQGLVRDSHLAIRIQCIDC